MNWLDALGKSVMILGFVIWIIFIFTLVGATAWFLWTSGILKFGLIALSCSLVAIIAVAIILKALTWLKTWLLG